jgi:UPF0755 protein
MGSSTRRRLLFTSLALVFLGGLAAVGTVNVVRRYLETPIGVPVPTTITVKRGSALKSTLAELEHQGIIVHPRWLYWYAQARGRTTIRAGEYVVAIEDTPVSLLDKLIEGRVKTEQLVVVEGHNRWLVRDALAAAHWMTGADFDRLCDSTSFLAKHDIPGPTCEGYLFPETYTFARGLAPETILGAMFTMFHKVYGAVVAGGRGPLGLDTRQLVTLASIVEKETGSPEERPHIACVFYNRLIAKPAWRLETDPTVIYAATLTDPHFDGNLKREHLHALDNPYNTYRVYGLPPGPIANPGRAALQAVVQPTACKDFFFVSMNNGQHIFCPTLGCHNKAVGEWQVEYFRKARGRD